MKAVVVYDYSRDTPREIGRAWVNPDGTATVRGFQQSTRERYQTDGIKDRTAAGKGQMVTPADGERFLRTLLLDWGTGSRVGAVEEDERARPAR